MSKTWYEEIPATERLMQGDLIFSCPVATWSSEPLELSNNSEAEALKSVINVIQVDVVVMTQACDLEQNKILNVTLCPHLALSEFKQSWDEQARARNQNPTEKAWKRFCDDLKDGYMWNLSLLNCQNETCNVPHRVVDFYDVFTLPRSFVESLLKQREQPRLRLLPPYREHLSQAFARFYMRVGLPTPIDTVW